MRNDTDLLGGRYEMRDVLGYGGMAEVRDGWDTRLDRPVAIKLLSPGFCTQPDMLARFRYGSANSGIAEPPERRGGLRQRRA